MDWLNYHHFYYFRVIAAEGSVSKAAERLKLGQPALSMQLKQFEAAIGQRLFERRGRKLILTPAGKLAMEYAGEIFRLGDQFLELMHDKVFAIRPDVHIGALDELPKVVSANLSAMAWKSGAGLVTLMEGSSEELHRELLSHRLDLILTNHPPVRSAKEKVIGRRVARYPVSIFGAGRFRKLNKGFPRSLNGQPLIMPAKGSRLEVEVGHYFRAHGMTPKVVGEVQDSSLQILLGQQGVGLIAMPRLRLDDAIQKGKLVEIGRLEHVSEEIWITSIQHKVADVLVDNLFKDFTC